MLKVTEVARPSRGLTPRAGGPRSVSAKPPAGSNWRTSRSPTFPSVKLASPGGLRRHGSGPADLAIDGDSPRGSPPNASFKWLRRRSATWPLRCCRSRPRGRLPPAAHAAADGHM